jgi:Kdo2-lipid IVA lauroyltransferase/acyltransferase
MLFFRLLSYLPLPVLYLITDFVYLVVRFPIGYRKKVIDENLQFAFPEKSQQERKKIRNKFYRNFTDTIAETIKLLTISDAELRNRFVLIDNQLPELAVKSGTSAIMTAGHMFNWEMAIQAIAQQSEVVTETVYLKLNNRFFNKLMLEIRVRFGGVFTEKKEFGKSMATLKSHPRIIQLASDQRPPLSQRRYKREFMNRPALFFEGAEVLAKKMNLPVYFGSVTKVKRGYYYLEFYNIATPPYENTPPHSITDAFCKILEDNIRNQPDLYLWSHKRWKV